MVRKAETVYGWNPKFGKRAVYRKEDGTWLTQSLVGKLWGMNPVRYFTGRDVKYKKK